MAKTINTKLNTANTQLDQLIKLSDDFYDLLVGNAYLYDVIEEVLYQ